GQEKGSICYILDGILFLYGIILSALYCRIKVGAFLWLLSFKIHPLVLQAKNAALSGLAPHEQSTYETIGQKK
uniref:Uncharacterized protein n=1 Tax=Takifugu rubripes TaxID=31033 RepID=A0A674NPL2_TAKRU